MTLNIHTMNNSEFNISILGFLTHEPMHGYELHKKVADLSGFGIVWNLKIGKLYAILRKLESEHLVKSNLAREGNRPIKHEFSITGKGKECFNCWLSKPVVKGRDFRTIFLLKLYFSLYSGKENAKELIDAQIEICKDWQIDRKTLNIKNQNINGNMDFENFPTVVNSFRQYQISSYLEWLNWCKNLSN